MTDPSTVSPAVAAMRSRAAACRVHMGGRPAMIEAGKTYLPQGATESEAKWKVRLQAADYFPAFADTVDAYVGKPFGAPIVVTDAPSRIEAALEDVDLCGRDHDSWCRDVFAAGLVDGITWAVADYPRVAPGLTLAQEQATGARPYLVHVPLGAVLGWRTARIGGRMVVTQFRYLETLEAADGEFATKTAQRVRVWKRDAAGVSVDVWDKQGEGGQWAIVVEESGPVSLPEIPVAAFAPGRTGHFSATPPLENLAWLNVTHWQSSSEQRHVLHASRVLLLAADEDVRADRGKKVELTQDSLLVGLKGIRYVTLDTGPIETGAKDLEAIEARMRTVAGQALTKPTGPAKTATESAQESRDGGSRLRRWTWDFQDFFEQCLKLMAAWINEKQGGSATVDADWDDLMDPSLFATALQARVQRELSRDAWLQLAQRAGVLQGSIEDEKDRLDAEPPESLATGLPMGA